MASESNVPTEYIHRGYCYYGAPTLVALAAPDLELSSCLVEGHKRS